LKILLAIEDSSCSDAAVEMVARRTWPAGAEVRVISVVKPFAPLASAPSRPAVEFFDEAEVAEQRRARAAVERAAHRISRNKRPVGRLKITTEIFLGSPKRIIIEEAERFGADLIVLGSHDRLSLERRLLGSVSQVVAAQAACQVEIVSTCQHV
jgi:nucleotide-binding universal stress UspA family protein